MLLTEFDQAKAAVKAAIAKGSSAPARDWKSDINPDSLKVLTGAKLEPSIGLGKAGDLFQFERQGYYCVDPDTTENNLVLNRTITLKDTWCPEVRMIPPHPHEIGNPTSTRSH